MSDDLKVLYSGDFNSPSGYSHAARLHARALIEAGVDVLVDNHKCSVNDIDLDPFWAEQLPQRMQRSDFAKIKIFHKTPEFYDPSPAQINVAMVAWETSEIPKWDIPTPRSNWVRRINQMTECWTFCQSSRKAFEKSGVTIPIRVFPHPLDHEIYRPLAKGESGQTLHDTRRNPMGREIFKFLSVFQWIPRKDPMSLLLAYMAEFRGDEPVVLIMKTYGEKPGDLQQIQAHIQQAKKGIRLPHATPRMMLVPGVLTDADMAKLHQASDCYVTTTRGEGFCLPAAESMACGVPVIAPKGTSFPDFVSENNGYLVDVIYEPVFGMVGSPWYYSTQNWHRTQITHLRKRMRDAYENRVALADRADKAEKAVRAFSFESVGKQMRKAIQELLARASG
jgi:glycosyltransferase involved in cell wall biosynthesis